MSRQAHFFHTAGLRRIPPPWGLGALCALGIWAGFPNDILQLPFLVLLWPATLTLLGLTARNSTDALRRGWLATLAGGMAALYWLCLPLHNVGGLPLILAVPCALFVVACISSTGGIFSLAAHTLRWQGPWTLALILGLCWYLLELGAALTLGFPWLTLTGALAAWPLLVQATDTTGAYALAGLWSTAALWFCFGFARLPTAEKSLPCLASGVGLTALILACGAWKLHADPLAEAQGPQSFEVLFVEGNVDQNQKWVPAFQRQTVDLYLGLTLAALEQKPHLRPLIVWPETALPFYFENNQLHSPRVRQLASSRQSPLLLGAPGTERRPGQKNPDVYNRAFLLGPDGRTVAHYDKEHLVPFGEYLPSWLDWHFLEALLQGVGVYKKGKATAPLRQGSLALGMLICYEGIFPWLAQARVADGANVLVDISNDGWFADTPAPRQHLYLTALRALEQNRWILRGTNTGISAVVDTRGRLVMSGGQFRAQALWARAQTQSAPSLFHRLSPWLPFAALALLLILTAVSRRSAASPHPQPSD